MLRTFQMSLVLCLSSWCLVIVIVFAALFHDGVGSPAVCDCGNS